MRAICLEVDLTRFKLHFDSKTYINYILNLKHNKQLSYTECYRNFLEGI